MEEEEEDITKGLIKQAEQDFRKSYPQDIHIGYPQNVDKQKKIKI